MKLILKILAAIVIVLLVAILALVFLFDLNRLKPHIEAAALEQGVALQIKGDLGWTFWPRLGVSVEDIHVAAATTPGQPIAQLRQAGLMVAIGPLFSGDIQVHHVRIEGAMIDLVVDQQGTGNWEALTADTTPAATDSPQTTPAVTDAPTAADEEAEKAFNLAVERISLINSALRYRDQQSGQDLAVEDIQLDVRQFNLQGDAFDLSLSMKTRMSSAEQPTDTPLVIAAELSNRVQIAPEFTQLQVSDGEAKITVNDRGSMTLRYSLTADDLQGAQRFSGKVEMPSFDAKALLSALGTEVQTSENYALKDVSLAATFVGDAQHLILEPVQLQLDKTRIDGRLAITDFAASAIQLTIKGDQINVDHYLAPSTPETQPASAGTGDEELIPLDTLRDLNATISVDFGRVVFADMPLENIQLRVKAAQGLVELQQGDARIYQGTVASTGSLDGRGNTANIRFNGKLSDVQLAPAMKDLELDQQVQLSGGINANASGTLRGVTLNQLLDTLVAEANVSGDQIRFAPLNVEEKFCQIVNLVNRTEDTQQRNWEDFTQMRELTGKITLAQRVVNIESISAGVHQLVLGVQGKINIASEEYDITLPLRLLQEESSANGCRVNSNYWINRSLSLLRCRGSLADLNPVKDCRPDSKGLTGLTKDFAEYKIREKHGDKIDALEKKADDKKDELRQRLDERLGTETEGQKPRDLLKGLINRKVEQKTAPKQEPAPPQESPKNE